MEDTEKHINKSDIFQRALKGDTSILTKQYSKNDLNWLSTPIGKYNSSIDCKSTCLNELAKQGKMEILSYKDELLTIDSCGRTPYHWLAMQKSSDGFVPLFNNNALYIKDEDGKTPAHYLAERNDVSSLPQKALAIIDENGDTPIHIMIDNNIKFDITTIPESILEICNAMQQTPCHLLAMHGDKSFLKCSKKVLNFKDKNNNTPIDLLQVKTSVTAKLKPWQRKMKVIIVPEKYITIDNIRFDWEEDGGKRIYNHHYANHLTLSFTLMKCLDNGDRIGITVMDLPSDNVYAVVSGEKTKLRKELEEWLSLKGVSPIDISSFK